MRARHARRVAWIAPHGELLAPPRLTAAAVRLAVQVLFVVCLWRALYASTAVSAGLDRGQAVSYAVLAVLISRIRGLDQFTARDNVLHHVQRGTIVYWFVRPLAPARYYLLRSAGDQVFGLAWAVLAYLCCLPLAAVEPPVSAAAGAVFLVSMLLGQVTLYYLSLVTDLLCFWLVVNDSVLRLVQFAQNLLSGAIAPLWFFPGWLRLLAEWLPFQAILHLPLSLYIGAIPLRSAPAVLAVQCGWCAGLAVLTRILWWRAGMRVAVQGG